MLTQRKRIQSTFTKPSRTKQAPAREVDINYIVNRYLKTGQMPLPQSEPQYGYVPAMDLAEAYEQIHAAEEHFLSLPAATRAAFNNSPVELLRAVENGETDLLRQHNLLRETEPEPSPAPPTVATLDVNSGSDTKPQD